MTCRLVLRSGRDRRVRGGHPWIFSNEIKDLIGSPERGDAVEVFSSGGSFLGTAYFNPHSLIAARLLTPSRENIDEPAFFRNRIANAALRREFHYPGETALRLVFGESDDLPGLVVDRYGQVLVVQFLTAGMDRRRDAIVAALQDLYAPEAIVARNDVAVRSLEGLPQEVELLAGERPERVVIAEHGLEFLVDVLAGQKTGHFLDQKENHLALRRRVEGRRVLDLFCYSGGWSLHAARFGAVSATGIDSSPRAVALAAENASRNALTDRCRFLQEDGFEALRKRQEQGERYGAIVLDPPAFVKSKSRLAEAAKGYLTINRRALELLETGGFLFTCSCSYHLSREHFLDILRQAAGQAGRTVVVEEFRGQALDHPVALSCPETDYLKCAVLRIF